MCSLRTFSLEYSLTLHFHVDILNEEPGSETASLLEVNRGKDSGQNMDYEEDFTDASSVVTEDDLKKVNSASPVNVLGFL